MSALKTQLAALKPLAEADRSLLAEYLRLYAEYEQAQESERDVSDPGWRDRQAAEFAVHRQADERAECDRLGILPEHRGATLGLLDESSATVVDQWATQGGGLLVKGPVGTGKTWCAVAALRTAVGRQRCRGRFVLARAFFRHLWDAMKQDRESAYLEDACALPVFVLDDLGHEGRTSEASIGALHEWLSWRLDPVLHTVVTTNLGLTELSEQYDASVASRLAAFQQITLIGTDRRRA